MVTTEGIFPILKYFKYDHLPEHLQETSKMFSDLAYQIANDSIDSGTDLQRPSGAEVTTALRKVLEAKDCTVRSRIK